MISGRLLELSQESLVNPWVLQLVADLAQQQPRSNQLVDELRRASPCSAVLWPFHAVQLPVAVREARGSRLWTADGREMLDLFLGFGTQALHGHNPPEVVEAVRKELGRTVGNAYFHEIELQLVAVLRELAPQNEAFLFLHSGTDATGAAVRLCRARTGRRRVVKLESAVHGVHDWGVQSSVALMHGHPLKPWPAIGPDGVAAVPFAAGVPAADAADLLVLPHLDRDAFGLLDEHRDDIACVIAESCNISYPFPARCVPFVRELSERSHALGIPFVLDEVQTGFRWGPGGAGHTESIRSDLRIYGKVLSGLGIPLSAVGGSVDFLRHASTSGLNITDYGAKTTFMTTHSGNHLALLAAHASLSALVSKGSAYYERTRARLAGLRARIDSVRSEAGIPLHLVGYGDFIGTFLFAHEPDRAGNARELAERVNPIATQLLSLELRRRGLYTYSWPFLFLGDAYTDADIARIGDEVLGAARAIAAAGIPLTVPWQTDGSAARIR